MKKYFFGYLFVRIAKVLAILLLLAGIGVAFFRLEQASISAQSASYQESASLAQRLNVLTETLDNARRLVSAFCLENGGAASTQEDARITFPKSIRNNDDFARLGAGLDQADRQSRQLKNTLVARFEALVESIQNKLRAHAAAVAPAAPTAPATATAGTVPAPPPATPATTPADQAETLYSNQIGNYQIRQKIAAIDQGKELLKVLETSAEDPVNRKILTDSVAQLDALSQLLPSQAETPVAATPSPVQSSAASTPAPPPRRELNAEKVAAQLLRLRASVRDSILTAWKVDAASQQALDLMVSEAERCRVASLSVKGIWLAAGGQIALALVSAIFAAFLILVLADFMQTLLDTATNTGVMAQAMKPE